MHDKVKCLAAPSGFRAHLPFGPDARRREEDEAVAVSIAARTPVADIDLGGNFALMVECMGKSLGQVAGLDEMTVAAHLGRNNGPRGTVRHAPVDKGYNAGKPNLVAKAWKKVAG